MQIYLVFFISIFGSPPSIMPEYDSLEKNKHVYFKSYIDCESYLIQVAADKYKSMEIISYGNGKYLKNSQNTQFVICKGFNNNGEFNLGLK